MLITAASSTAPMPAESPTATASRMKRASPELLSELRNRTAPAIPAIYSLSTSIADPQARMGLLGNLSTVCNIGYVVSPLAFGSMSSAYGMPFSWRMMSVAAVICLGMLLLAQLSGMFRPRAAAGIINDV